jgi:hypothetical protein
MIEGSAPVCMIDDDEEGLLHAWWVYFLSNFSTAEFVGHCIFRFDLPFLVKRSRRYGLPVPDNVWNGRWWDPSFIDLAQVWAMGNKDDTISLDRMARWLGVGSKNGEGKMFHTMPREQQELYLANDLSMTMACALRMLPGRSRSV